MEVLKSSFSKNGFNFTQIKRVGRIALFKKLRITTNNEDSYEVVIISKHNGFFLGGNFVKAAECYPSSGKWGEQGWTYKMEELEKANLKFNELVNKEGKKI